MEKKRKRSKRRRRKRRFRLTVCLQMFSVVKLRVSGPLTRRRRRKRREDEN